MTLTDFLLQRIVEDEAVAQAAIADDVGSDEGFSGQYESLVAPPSGVGLAQGGFGEAAALMIATYAVPSRVLAECEAKRRIVSRCDMILRGRGEGMFDEGRATDARDNLRALALPHADHPDFREEWRVS